MQDAWEDGEKTLIGSTCGPQKIRERKPKMTARAEGKMDMQ